MTSNFLEVLRRAIGVPAAALVEASELARRRRAAFYVVDRRKEQPMSEQTLTCKTCIADVPDAANPGSAEHAAITFATSDDYMQHRADEHGDCVICGQPKDEKGKFICLHEQIERRPRAVRQAIAKGELPSDATELPKGKGKK